MDKKLQVMISTLGRDGISRVAEHMHPEMPGVEYVVVWQKPEGEVPPSIASRKDFRIVATDTRGLSVSRNIALDEADGPVMLLSDDDVDYTAEQLELVMRVFSENPGIDIAAFRYHSAKHPKPYPAEAFDLSKPTRGWWLTSFELALRPGRVPQQLRFDPRFGVGADLFCAGEEDLFLHGCLKGGMKGRFFPIDICTCEASTTASRMGSNPEMMATKGAVVALLHPLSWPLRFPLLAMRSQVRFTTAMKYMLQGVKLEKESRT